MRLYEIIYIMKPDVSEEDVDRFIAQMGGVVSSGGGQVQKTEKWGRRKLAYQVRHHREGYYVLTVVECDPPTLREFERILKVSEPVIKFLAVRIDEELKRLEKLRRRREKQGAARGAGTAPPAAPAPAPPAPPPVVTAPPAPEATT